MKIEMGGEDEALAPRAEGTRRRSMRRLESRANPFLA
jgi:hypothetical protein